MNDYIELVAKCEEWIAKADNFGADDLANHISRCADVIEQLVKERDEWQDRYFEQARKCFQLEQEFGAVVADFAEQRVCNICKHAKTHIDDEPCNSCKVFRKDGNQTRFEWRGVQEDNDETN